MAEGGRSLLDLPPEIPARIAFPAERDDEQPGPRSAIFIALEPEDPGDGAGRKLRTLERITLAAVWATAVICTLFGAGSAHLPPAGTIILVVLEIVIPPVVFRGWNKKTS
jgi:hypothetical protein